MEMILNNQEELNTLFQSGKITAIFNEINFQSTTNMELIIRLSNLKNLDYKNFNEQIYYLSPTENNMLFNITIKEDFKYYLENYNEEKLLDFLKKFNLESEILNRNYLELSSGEKRKILLIIALLVENKLVVLEHPTMNLDVKSIQTLIKELRKIRRENKKIIIISYNTNFLLEAVDNIILIENNKTINFENKFEVLCDEKLMNKLNLKIPNVLNFIKEVKAIKNIKLGNRENISELIKDIYRYAK